MTTAELWDRAHAAYKALNGGIAGGVSDVRRGQLEEEWKAAHRAWWDAVQAEIAGH
jgi:hypothetical protein